MFYWPLWALLEIQIDQSWRELITFPQPFTQDATQDQGQDLGSSTRADGRCCITPLCSGWVTKEFQDCSNKICKCKRISRLWCTSCLSYHRTFLSAAPQDEFGEWVVETRASVKHWMKPEPFCCKQPCLLFLVEVEMFKSDCHMKRSDWVNSHLTDTRCGESGALSRSCRRTASTAEHSGSACNRPPGIHKIHNLVRRPTTLSMCYRNQARGPWSARLPRHLMLGSSH